MEKITAVIRISKMTISAPLPIHSLVLYASALCVALVVLASSEDIVTSSFCPKHCQCFTVSYSSPPESRQLQQYVDRYQWAEGSKVVVCSGRGKIPRNIAPDTQYLLLLGNGKTKRRNKKEHKKEHKKEKETIQSIQSNPGDTPGSDVQSGGKSRQIKTVEDDAFNENLQHLDLSGNKVKALNSNTFQNMKNLESLNLRHNRLKRLPKGVFRDLSKLIHLDLSGNNMRFLSADLFRNTTNIISLDVSDNLINYLPERSLHWLVHLQRLNASHNRLIDLPKRLLIDLIDIREIYLENNKLRVIAHDMFHKNTKLEILSLRNNNIRDLEEYAFYFQPNLRRLDLSENRLVHIPNTIFSGTQAMLWLDLSRNNISTIDDGAFARIENLTDLNLSYNRLDAIHVDTLNELPKLRKLNFAHNNITFIAPGSLQGLKLLEILDLTFNNLQHIEAHTFYGLEELTDLHLQDNIIKTLAAESFKVSTFSFTSKLTWLNLQRNQLSFIEPHAFYGAPNVKVLNLAYNDINTIDKNSFHGLLSLKTLILSTNNLRTIESDSFHFLHRLESLDLASNDIETIASGSFQRCGKLRELLLEDNYLNGNSFDWTKGMISLEKLNLNKNAMRTFPVQIFLNMDNLRTLTLNQNGISQLDIPDGSSVRLSKLSVAMNEITSFDQSIQRVLQTGSILDLSSNPWNCTCALTSTVDQLKTSWRVKFEHVTETTCATPQSLQQSLLYSLPTEELCAIKEINQPLPDSDEATGSQDLPVHAPCQTTHRLSSQPGVWPWHAILWNTISRKVMCNGALIGPNWVLASLQCLEPHTSFGRINETHEAIGHLKGTLIVPRHWVIKLGKSKELSRSEPNEQVYSILHVHALKGDTSRPDWDRLLLIEISSLASVSPNVLPICLADRKVPIQNATVTGWRAPTRRHKYTLISSNFTSAPVCLPKSSERNYVCTEKNDGKHVRYAIQHNLGAPMVTNIADSWFVVGIVTNSTPEETKFIDVRPFYRWIQWKMGLL